MEYSYLGFVSQPGSLVTVHAFMPIIPGSGKPLVSLRSCIYVDGKSLTSGGQRRGYRTFQDSFEAVKIQKTGQNFDFACIIKNVNSDVLDIETILEKSRLRHRSIHHGVFIDYDHSTSLYKLAVGPRILDVPEKFLRNYGIDCPEILSDSIVGLRFKVLGDVEAQPLSLLVGESYTYISPTNPRVMASLKSATTEAACRRSDSRKCTTSEAACQTNDSLTYTTSEAACWLSNLLTHTTSEAACQTSKTLTRTTSKTAFWPGNSLTCSTPEATRWPSNSLKGGASQAACQTSNILTCTTSEDVFWPSNRLTCSTSEGTRWPSNSVKGGTSEADSQTNNILTCTTPEAAFWPNNSLTCTTSEATRWLSNSLKGGASEATCRASDSTFYIKSQRITPDAPSPLKPTTRPTNLTSAPQLPGVPSLSEYELTEHDFFNLMPVLSQSEMIADRFRTIVTI
ncbi:serine-rich adhesin for platelets-like [Palaemon carinicauda]|uniref:serine-rich adhesin for platelets-like n=1 Tax=Palaemon carinicauda TaxID=392227 RepID=UPI0035B6469A